MFMLGVRFVVVVLQMVRLAAGLMVRVVVICGRTRFVVINLLRKMCSPVLLLRVVARPCGTCGCLG